MKLTFRAQIDKGNVFGIEFPFHAETVSAIRVDALCYGECIGQIDTDDRAKISDLAPN